MKEYYSFHYSGKIHGEIERPIMIKVDLFKTKSVQPILSNEGNDSTLAVHSEKCDSKMSTKPD